MRESREPSSDSRFARLAYAAESRFVIRQVMSLAATQLEMKDRNRLESFSVLTELAIAIAGFSGITIAIHGRARSSDAVTTFRNKNLITWSLGAAFGSTLPDAMSHLGAFGADIWILSSLFYTPFILALIVVPFMTRARLSKADRARLSPAIWIFGIGGAAFFLAALLANAAGMFGEPSSAPVYLCVLWTIFLAAVQFFRLLFAPDSAPAA